MQTEAAVVMKAGEPLAFKSIAIEDPRPDEIIVRVVSAGVCHTDLAAAAGSGSLKVPEVLGHEGAGMVERVGAAVTRLAPGDHVVLSFDSCGWCDRCVAGRPSYCRQFMPLNFGGTRLDGSSALSSSGAPVYGHYFGQSSFARHCLARERNAIKVATSLPIEKLGPLGCGVQTGAGAVLNAFGARTGSSVAVFGAGSVGLSAVMAARVAGCTRIIAVDVKPARLEMARRLGATHTIDGSRGDTVRQIVAITGAGANFAFDTTGVPAVVRQAIDSLDEVGTCGLVAGGGIDLPPSLRGRTVRGIIEGDAVPELFIPMLIDLWQQGRFPFDQLITEFDFADINTACAASLSGEAIKPVLRFEP